MSHLVCAPVRFMGLFACVVSVATLLVPSLEVRAEVSPLSQDAFLRAKHVTVGILAETQDQRVPERPGKIAVRGTGVHLRDGYVITARHAAEKHDLSGGTIIQKQIRLLTHDFHELSADLVGDSAFMDAVVYRIVEQHRSKLQVETSFSTEDVLPGMEVFTVGYPLGWGPTMAFGRLGNTNTFLQTVDTRLIQADLSVCSGNSGGGLFNAQGEVVGILHAVIQTDKEETQAYCSRMAFAIPGSLAERIVQAALSGKPLLFSKLGIHMTSVKDGTKLRMAVKDVAEPAKTAGIQKHDILLAIENTEIVDGAQLKNYLIERTTPGQEVAVKVRRVDADLTFHVVLGGGEK
ncbi:MAG: putative Serine protease [Candidatus Nitrospira kreftii]|uniref:Putative Serine protease n=1 Tax=Candidatus Nitrospira kreftii TaxID=2652173 RepID=A0A7S8FFA3_9BACT|nr:MAG: putative Serine protease [Candidatus Nitrospira kreftii]